MNAATHRKPADNKTTWLVPAVIKTRRVVGFVANYVAPTKRNADGEWIYSNELDGTVTVYHLVPGSREAGDSPRKSVMPRAEAEALYRALRSDGAEVADTCNRCGGFGIIPFYQHQYNNGVCHHCGGRGR